MELTVKENIRYNSNILKHNIATQAVMLLQGREGSLKTEKEIYTVLAIMENVVNENLIELCNDDERDLMDIMELDIEPLFDELLKNEEFKELYNQIMMNVNDYCDKVYAEQHSVRGLVDTIVDLLSSLDNSQVEEVLEKTGEMAAQVKEKHNEIIEKQNAEYQEKILNKEQEISSALKEVMKQYNVKTDDETK